MNYIQKTIHRKEWVDLLSQNNTRYLVTVTLNQDTSEEQSLRTVKSLLKRIRNDYFGRNPKRQFLSGYLIIEHQRSGRPHYHIIIQDHPILHRQNRDFRKVFMKHCHSLSLIDETKGVKIQDYYKDNLEGYLTKSIEHEHYNFDFIHPLTYDGL
jgi:hypothetical protein